MKKTGGNKAGTVTLNILRYVGVGLLKIVGFIFFVALSAVSILLKTTVDLLKKWLMPNRKK